MFHRENLERIVKPRSLRAVNNAEKRRRKRCKKMKEYRISPDVCIFTGKDIYVIQERKKFLFFRWWAYVDQADSVRDAITRMNEIRNK